MAIDGRDLTGTTDGTGALRQPIPATAEQGTLVIGDWTLPLLIGHLDPMAPSGSAGIAGVQGRLRNLGYDPGEINGVLTDQTKAAIRAFEANHTLAQTGQVSQAVIQKLKQQYGC